jgi:hypothetical protein
VLIELLARWLCIPIAGNVRKEAIAEAIAEKIVGEIDDNPVCRSLLFLFEFEKQKRKNAVFNFAKYFLPQEQYCLFNSRLQKDSWKRFSFIFAVFLYDPTRLRSLMLYSQLEKADTVRH